MNPRVVVVDDDPVVRLLMSECLGIHGYSVQTLDHATAGLDWLSKNDADVIFVDLMMPDMTGLELLKKIKAIPGRDKIPVVLLSANAERGLTQSDPDAKPDYVLEKPWDLQVLLKTLSEITSAPKAT